MIPPDWKPAVMLLPIATYRWNIAPPAYSGMAGGDSLSSLQPAAARASPNQAATEKRLIVIVRLSP